MQKRDYSLDFIKIIATIIIVFHHYQQVTGVIFDRGINFYNGIFYFGYVVELFFIISGYLMFDYIEKIYSGLDFKNFFTKRFIRIFPMMVNAAIFYEFFLVIYQNIYCADILIFSPIFLAIIAVLWYNKRNGGDILWQDLKSTKSNLRMMS